MRASVCRIETSAVLSSSWTQNVCSADDTTRVSRGSLFDISTRSAYWVSISYLLKNILTFRPIPTSASMAMRSPRLSKHRRRVSLPRVSDPTCRRRVYKEKSAQTPDPSPVPIRPYLGATPMSRWPSEEACKGNPGATDCTT